MSFTNPIARHTGAKFYEGSAQRSDRDSDATQRLWAKNLSTAQQLARTVQCVEQLQRQLDRLRKRGGEPVEAGWSWASPIKYDHTKSLGKGNVVVIMPSDTIVTAGATSASFGTEGTTVMAQPGIWVSMQAVAPEDQGGGTFWYHVPHMPLPDESDIDSEQNFWIQITAFCES